ncbi:hypothetical protein [Halobellus limi]|uniref:hypothetical protein n=1 Tax=Halobellus limi TaxID=699433 RepID=UPI001F0FA088|nr:hypothetical protein [Halobellus limi]
MSVPTSGRCELFEPCVLLVISRPFPSAGIDHRLELWLVVLLYTRPDNDAVADSDTTGHVRTSEHNVVSILASAFVAAVSDGLSDLRPVEGGLDDGAEDRINEEVVVLEADAKVIDIRLTVGTPRDELLGSVGSRSGRLYGGERIPIGWGFYTRWCGEPSSIRRITPAWDSQATIALIATEWGETGETSSSQ